MPELPEVETIVRELQNSSILGKTIKNVQIFWEKTIATPTPKEFIEKIKGQTIEKISRRGKWIVIHLSSDTLLIHLRMTGKLKITRQKEILSSHERVRLSLNNEEYLHFEDQRKFGKWYLFDNPEKKYAELGVEPFSKEFTLNLLEKLLRKTSTSIKAFLLNQRYIVGIGNIYADEALWLARIHPLRKTNSLTKKEIKVLFEAIPQVLQIGINNQGTTLGSHTANYYSLSGNKGNNQGQLKVFRQEGLACPRCQTTIIKITIATRGTHLCPNCQKI